MAHIPDLTRFTYEDSVVSRAKDNVLAVGWLEKPDEIPQGKNPMGIMALIKSAKGIFTYRGTQGCHWCGKSLGNSDIWLQGKSGTAYVLPSGVMHYIEEHGYKLPDQMCNDTCTVIPPPTGGWEARSETFYPRYFVKNDGSYLARGRPQGPTAFEKQVSKAALEIRDAEDARIFGDIDKWLSNNS
jgi:hypothetical protein